MKMQIGKWGNSLAVRLPKDVIAKHNLKEGDSIDVEVLNRALELSLMSRKEVLERIRALQRPLPVDWKFDREAANAR